jgi:hypothetical protein
MNKVEGIVAMIKRLNVQELKELHRRLGEFPNWPPMEAVGVPVKPKPTPPMRSTRAARRARR